MSLPLVGLYDTLSGVNAPVAKIPANGSVTVQVAGKAGIPASGVSAVALNIWKRGGSDGYGYLVLRPSDKPSTAVTLYYNPTDHNSTDDLIRLTSTGKLTLTNTGPNPVDVRIAVRGYFLDASATQAATEYHPLTAAYLYDSRPGIGPADGPKTPLASKTPITLQVTGKAGVPATGVDSVAINIAALGATTNAGLSLWADGESDPTSSTLLYTAGENNSLTDIVRVGANGRIRLVNHGANPINVAIAVRGYFKKTTTTGTEGAGFEAVEPKTLLRTDSGVGTPGATTTPLAARASLTFTATSATSTPLQRISAVAGSLTAYAPAATGSLSITPTGGTEAKLGTLQFMKGETSQLTDIVRPGTDGKLTVTNHSDATVHVQFSIRGYFLLPEPQHLAEAGEVIENVTGTEDLSTAVASDEQNLVVATGMAPTALLEDPATPEDPAASEPAPTEPEPVDSGQQQVEPNGASVTVPRDPSAGVTFSGEGGSTTIGLPAAGTSIVTEAGTVVYDGSQQGFSTGVQPTVSGGARLLVQMEGANSPTSYSFPVRTVDGAVMLVDPEDGGIDIVKEVDTEDGPVMEGITRINAPWARDAAGRDWPAKYTVDGNNILLDVDLTPRVENDETVEPTFPVVADPDVSAMSAFGCQSMHSFSYAVGGATLKVPAGLGLCHIVKGKGKRIEYQRAGIERIGPGTGFPKFYNWEIDFVYFDDRGKRYQSLYGPIHNTGTYGPFRSIGGRTLPHYGKACAGFNVNGRQRVKQCHYITR